MLEWRKVEDGHCNEKTTTYKGQMITIYSDNDGNNWGYIIKYDSFYKFNSEEKAISEAMNEVDRHY